MKKVKEIDRRSFLGGVVGTALLGTLGSASVAEAQGAPAKYRDPESEKIVVKLLTDAKARSAFLNNRSAYLAQSKVPADAKSVLMNMSPEVLEGTAKEFAFNFRRKPADSQTVP